MAEEGTNICRMLSRLFFNGELVSELAAAGILLCVERFVRKGNTFMITLPSFILGSASVYYFVHVHNQPYIFNRRQQDTCTCIFNRRQQNCILS